MPIAVSMLHNYKFLTNELGSLGKHEYQFYGWLRLQVFGLDQTRSSLRLADQYTVLVLIK